MSESDNSNGCRIVTDIPHDSQVLSIAFHPTLNIIAAGCRDSTVKLWDCTNPQDLILMKKLTAHTDDILFITFHPKLPFMATRLLMKPS